MSETKSAGPRTRQEARAQVAQYLIAHLAKVQPAELCGAAPNAMTDAQVKRLEDAAGDITARLRKLAGE